jgi:predicted signal transduction protein with EAL and GGDEF domain
MPDSLGKWRQSEIAPAHPVGKCSGYCPQFNLSVVAEGVETCEDGLLLRTLKGAVAQGYFIFKPIVAGALLTWWLASRVRLQGVVKHPAAGRCGSFAAATRLGL